MTRHTTVSARPVHFAGIDFHKKFSVVTLGDADGKQVLHEKLSNEVKTIEKFFAPYAGISCAIENCRGSEWFVELLKQLGLRIHVSNTYAVKLISESRCKTDKIDSRILMELLAKGFLPTIYQPSRDERLLRERLRWRVRLVRSRTQYRNRAHALLDKEHMGCKLDSRKSREAAGGQSGLSIERSDLFNKHVEVMEFFELEIGREDQWVVEESRKNPDAQRLKTIPGIGDISALMLIAELGDISRFKKARNVSGYLGLVPRLYSSSETRRLGSITKQGPSILRWLLVQDAWAAIKKSEQIRYKFMSISKRRGKKVAIIAIARTLAEVSYRVLRDKTTFDPSLLTLG